MTTYVQALSEISNVLLEQLDDLGGGCLASGYLNFDASRAAGRNTDHLLECGVLKRTNGLLYLWSVGRLER